MEYHHTASAESDGGAVDISQERWQSSTSQTGHYVRYMSSDGHLGDKSRRAEFGRRCGEQRSF